NTSCNSLTGPLKLDGNKISFKQGLATTKMLCQGSGEGVFLKALETVETYQIKDDTLSFSGVNGELMRFVRK
ncbi:META domain-containing protein, partial [Pseudoxanthomonas sp. SGD-10]